MPVWAAVIAQTLSLGACSPGRTGAATGRAETAAPTPGGPRCEPAAHEEAQGNLEWAGADTLIVDERWLLTPSTGEMVPVGWPLVETGSSGRPESRGHALSPSGRRIAVETLGGLLVGDLRGRPGAPAPMPPVDSSVPPGELDDVWTVLAFVDERRVLVRRFERYAGRVNRCEVFDSSSGEWSPMEAECLRGAGSDVTRVVTGPEGLAAVFSVGEGHSAFEVVRLTAAGQRPLESWPGINLYPGSRVLATFSAGEPLLWLTTPCPFELADRTPTPCRTADGAGIDDDNPFRLFRWRVGESALRMVTEGLPSRAVAAPDGETLAWPRGRCVCVGDHAGSPRLCVEKPRP